MTQCLLFSFKNDVFLRTVKVSCSYRFISGIYHRNNVGLKGLKSNFIKKRNSGKRSSSVQYYYKQKSNLRNTASTLQRALYITVQHKA